MKLVSGVFQSARRALVSGVVVILLAVNLLMVTSAQFFDMVSSLFEALPIKGLMANSPSQKHRQLAERNAKLKEKNTRMRRAVSHSSESIKKRLARSAARDATVGGFEFIPIFGGGIAMADTAFDAWDTCMILGELHGLESRLTGIRDVDQDFTLCGFSIADGAELDSVQGDPSVAHDIAIEDYDSHTTSETIGETTAIAKENIQSGWERFRTHLGGTLAEIFGD